MPERFNGPYTVRYLKPEESPKLFLFDADEWPGMVRLETGVLYVDAEKSVVYYLCPCNGTHPDGDCKKYATHIPINISRGWSFKDENGVPSISPSVFREPQKNGCHYFITNGMVQWC